MGMRLNIEIKKKGEDKILANCYYHWSAYTMSALKMAQEIASRIQVGSFDDEKNDVYKAIKLLQITGAGLEEKEYDLIKDEDKKYFSISQDRNNGLIAFTEKSMKETRTWQEGILTIELVDYDESQKLEQLTRNKTTIIFEVYSTMEIDEVKDWYEEEIKNGDLKLENIPTLDYNLEELSLNELVSLINDIEYCENNTCGMFKIKGNEELIYQSIY